MSSLLATSEFEMLCNALKQEPLLHVSLGSKELFHSNLLAWMVRCFPERARLVFEPWLRPADWFSEDRARREFKHLDLVVELVDHQAIVIENKMFALPDEQQLARYSEGVTAVRGDPTLLLLSLTDPGWPSGTMTIGGRTWKWVSYRDLAARLANQFADDSEFSGQILAHEAVFVRLLCEVFEATRIQSLNDPLLLPGERVETLDHVGLADAVGKARAHQVMRFITDAWDQAQVAPPEWPANVGFTNGEPSLWAFWKAAEDAYVGWQFQGRQWRLAMILRSSSLYGKGRHDARAKFAAQHETYFDFTPMYAIFDCAEADCLPRKTHISPRGFNRYDPDFVYRYRNLPESTVGQLVDLAVTYSRRAEAWSLA
jgi:hypothetical protein